MRRGSDCILAEWKEQKLKGLAFTVTRGQILGSLDSSSRFWIIEDSLFCVILHAKHELLRPFPTTAVSLCYFLRSISS